MTIFGVSQERFEQAWTYDRGGNTATIGYPICFAGTCPAPGTTPRTASYTVTNGYLTAIPGWANSISYQLNGMLNTTSYANNISQVVVSDPNSIPRPQDIQYKVTSTGAVIGSLGPYEYDSSGNIKKLNGLNFTYDLVSRLKSAAVNVVGVPKTFTAAYDGYGNITSMNFNGTGRPTPTSASTNRLTSGAYDAGGNLISWNLAAYGYDRLNMPTQICSSGTVAACSGEKWLYAYTADDERILEYRVGGGAFRTTLRDLSGKALREYFVDAASNWSVFQDYIYRDSTLLASVHPTEGTRFFGPDHLGTPRAVFNSAGSLIGLHTYYPFGEEATAATADTQQMKFTGHERDLLNTPTNIADDTDYMHARQFSIQTARFHSFDPIGGNPREPQSFNRYAYVVGNPMKYSDPLGLLKDACDGNVGPCPPPPSFEETIDVIGSLGDPLPPINIFDVAFGPYNGVNRFSVPRMGPGSGGSSGGLQARFIVSLKIYAMVLTHQLAVCTGQILGTAQQEAGCDESLAVINMVTGGGPAKGARILQGAASHTISKATLRELGLSRGQAKSALERFKRGHSMPPDFHPRIGADGSLFHPANGDLLGNIHQWL